MWLDIAIAVGLIVWAVGGLIALNPLPWHIRKYWDVPGEKELRIIQAIALLLIVAGVTVFFVTEPGSLLHDLWPEMISTGGAVLGIDELNRRRSAQEYKQSVIRQMGSLSNDFALDAARIAKNEGWLEDGSFIGADLMRANLAGAHLADANLKGAVLLGANLAGVFLWEANLAGAELEIANLIRADLVEANLTGAELVEANLAGANLSGTNLTGANLSGANLTGASLSGANLIGVDLWAAKIEGVLYNSYTKWPDDFDPIAAGAINSDEMSEQERKEWKKSI